MNDENDGYSEALSLLILYVLFVNSIVGLAYIIDLLHSNIHIVVIVKIGHVE